MKKFLLIAIIAGSTMLSCSKKSTPAPTSTNVIEYTFTADNPGAYVMNYYDGVSLGSALSITTSTWSQKVNIPVGASTANIFFTAGENPPYQPSNTGVITIKLNGKVVATGSKQFTNTSTLATASYTFTGN